MFAITISEKGGESKRVDFDKQEVTIGRVQGNDIILPKGNVSKRHSRIVLKDGKFIIVDLKSTNGTYVNGRKITSPLVIKASDKVYIGDFILVIDEEGSAADLVEDGPSIASPPPASMSLSSSAPSPRGGGTIPPPPPRRATAAMGAAHGEVLEPPLPPPPAPPDAHEFQEADVEPPLAAPPASVAAVAARPASRVVSGGVRPTVMGEPVVPRSQSSPIPVTSPLPPIAAKPASPMRQAAAPTPAAAAPPVSRPHVEPKPIAPPPAAEPPRSVARPEPVVAVVVPASAPIADSGPLEADGASFASHDRSSLQELTRRLSQRLASDLKVDSLSPAALADRELRGRAERLAGELLEEIAESVKSEGAGGVLPESEEQAAVQDALAEALGTGPLAALLADQSIREISVPRYDRIYVDRAGDIDLFATGFSSAEALSRAIARLSGGAAARGHLVETRLADGTVLVAALGPLATQGAALTLRRGRLQAYSLDTLVDHGLLSQAMAELLELAVSERRNVLVSGVPSTERSQLVAALADASPESERIAIIEESEELLVRHSHAVRLSAQAGGRDALSAALRLRPERLVVVDVHDGATAIDALVALPGTILAAAGSSPADAVARLITQARLVSGQSAEVLRAAIADHLQLVVQISRGTDGSHRVVRVSELRGINDRGQAHFEDIFHYRTDGKAGRFQATGQRPSFAQSAPSSLFQA